MTRCVRSSAAQTAIDTRAREKDIDVVGGSDEEDEENTGEFNLKVAFQTQKKLQYGKPFFTDQIVEYILQ